MTLIPYADWRPIVPLRPCWTEERVTRMKLLWREGLSAELIARELGGVTRNAVIGKLTRIGLTGKGHPTTFLSRHLRRGRNYSSKHRPPAEVYARALEKPELSVRPADLVEPESKRLTILQVTNAMCKYTPDDGPPWAFCGHPTERGRWCPFHRAIVYEPERGRVRA